MSRFGKKLVVVGISLGIGILAGMQFSSSLGTNASTVLPGWNGATGTAQTAPAGQKTKAHSVPVAGLTQGGQAYMYVPVVVDPVTGAYSVVPVQPQTPAGQSAAGNLPQQEVQDYSSMSPEQILIPEEQKPTVDKLADKTAGLLQEASQKSIRWVVSLFDSAEK
ncbi:hypothetical protein A3844_05030 [Paenibacillus helianthi]|uniref:Uncharacterized protein n=1 Tax=Paenibacillus helianthi TaxID=1349432 RepID=A0ABX3EVP0_9BACL|nr:MULTISPECIES: hypothetical protein [Paenibacillus]OKP78431.1 hypothetical protein A3842_14345 [Paenibacillus sp. P3E]OKP88761.1 hypothetical protein A3848_17505 [Paenibacillus sp. P32E]OKP91194.1 hypothetical protein A3844_05030 [Paenibacillus helianthi]